LICELNDRDYIMLFTNHDLISIIDLPSNLAAIANTHYSSRLIGYRLWEFADNIERDPISLLSPFS
jgi:hypothetical protein